MDLVWAWYGSCVGPTQVQLQAWHEYGHGASGEEVKQNVGLT